jgi:rod shape determining protein RodA
MMDLRLWRRFDPWLLAAAVGLLAYGLVMIWSAAASGNTPDDPLESPVTRQLLFGLAGLVLFVAVSTVDYRLFGHLAETFYAVTVALLILVLLVGDATYGARRWINFGPVPVQPSELAKFTLILTLAKVFTLYQDRVKSFRVFGLSLAATVPFLALVYAQPDLGTDLVLGAIWLGMALMAGVRFRYLVGLGVLGVILSPLAFRYLLRDYMKERLMVFFNPMLDPLGAGYNVRQSEISVGSGGLWGRGLGQGSQTQLNFLRVQYTDFIFSVIGEELGFVGAMVLFGLFILLLFRGIRAGMLAPDDFGRLVATGIVIQILVQAFINIGANSRLLPVTGIPLPLISYGGSSLLTTLMSLGLLESIVMRHKRLEFD